MSAWCPLSDDLGPKGLAALAYAELGWKIFPVSSDDKAPAIKGGHGFKDATDDAEIIRAHWSRRPDDNVGLALGMSGFCAVDEDPRNGGDEELEAAELELGPLPRDCVASTAGGGRHFLMRLVEGRAPRGKPDLVSLGLPKAKGIDFKQNGYILLEPSSKPPAEPGGPPRCYQWLELDPENIPEVPAAWVDALYKPDTADAEAPHEGAAVELWSTCSDPTISDEDLARLRRHLRGLGPRAEGKNTTYRAVAAIFHDWGLSVVEGWPLLVEWNEGCGQPHPEHELHRQVHRVSARPQLGKRGRARRDIPLSAQIARAAVMVDAKDETPGDPSPDEDDEEAHLDDASDSPSGPGAEGDPVARANPTRTASDIDAMMAAALEVEPPRPAQSEVDAHLTVISRRWARSSNSRHQIAAGRSIQAALKSKWFPPAGEDPEAAVAHLASSIVLAMATPVGRESPPTATDAQLATYLPFRAGAEAIAAARAAPVVSISPAVAPPPPDPEGRGPIDVNAWGDSWELDPRTGLPKVSRTNVILALHRLDVILSFDELAQTKLVAVGDGDPVRWGDEHLDEIWDAIEGKWGFRVPVEDLRRWIGVRARERSFHPVRDYLDGLEWDGVPRLDTWLSTYAGVVDSPLARAVARIVLVAACRRVRQPGCKFDEILILEGIQGGGKSTLVEILAVQKEWFGAGVPFHKEAREQVEAIKGKWICEAGELAGITRADTRALKEFCSRPFDEARAAYAHEPKRLLRQCVFIGTINEGAYLTDPTGARRFWPFKCGVIDTEGLRRDVDQLWAEAAVVEATGESIRLDREHWGAASVEQELRRVVDAYELAIEEAGLGHLEDGGLVGKIKKADVLSVLGIAVSDGNLARVGAVMARYGWEAGRARFGTDGTRLSCFVRGADERREVELRAQGKRVVVVPSPSK